MTVQKHTQPRPIRRYATLAEAGEYTRTSEWTIRRRVSDGTLRGLRFGRKILVDLDEVDAAMSAVPSADGAA